MAINDELGDGSLSRTPNDLFGGAGRGLDVDFLEWDIVLGQEAPGGSAIGAPEGRIERNLHLRRI
jgi:hypothetical protein